MNCNNEVSCNAHIKSTNLCQSVKQSDILQYSKNACSALILRLMVKLDISLAFSDLITRAIELAYITYCDQASVLNPKHLAQALRALDHGPVSSACDVTTKRPPSSTSPSFSLLRQFPCDNPIISSLRSRPCSPNRSIKGAVCAC